MVRQAKLSDLSNIAAVHMKCFPDSFSTCLGGKLLEKFYSEYIKDVPELFLVCEDEKKNIVGFCMGYYMEKNDYSRSFLKHNFFSICFKFLGRLLCGDKRAWKKLKKNKDVKWVLKDEKIHKIPNEKKGDLLSICVLNTYRGKGYASDLINSYEQVLAKRGRKICILSVETDNGRGVGFYEKQGYTVYGEAGKIKRTYAKKLEA